MYADKDRKAQAREAARKRHEEWLQEVAAREAVRDKSKDNTKGPADLAKMFRPGR